MLYKIDNSYYIKASGHFVKVELIYSKDDVSLKPTDEKIECSNDVQYKEINFLSIKDKLLKEHVQKEEKSIFEQSKHENKISNKRYSR